MYHTNRFRSITMNQFFLFLNLHLHDPDSCVYKKAHFYKVLLKKNIVLRSKWLQISRFDWKVLTEILCLTVEQFHIRVGNLRHYLRNGSLTCYRHLEWKPFGTLEVKLIRAKELENKDVVGKSNPFSVYLFVH